MNSAVDPAWSGWGDEPSRSTNNPAQPSSSSSVNGGGGWGDNTASASQPMMNQQNNQPSSTYNNHPQTQMNNSAPSQRPPPSQHSSNTHPPSSSASHHQYNPASSSSPGSFHSAPSGSQVNGTITTTNATTSGWKPISPTASMVNAVDGGLDHTPPSFNGMASHAPPRVGSTQAVPSNSNSNGQGWNTTAPSTITNAPQNNQVPPPSAPAAGNKNDGWITSADDVKPASTFSSPPTNNGSNSFPPPASVPPATTPTNSQGWNAPSSFQAPPASSNMNGSNGSAHAFSGSNQGGFSSGNGGNTSTSWSNGNGNGNNGGNNNNSWGNGGSGGGNNSFGQERRAPPVYVFTIPNECKGYVIGAGGANLQRIQDETGIRVTQGRPKADPSFSSSGGNPPERDFLIFNDDNLPVEKVELALIKVVTIARRKLRDWLPIEGKAGDDAKRFMSEGRFEDGQSSSFGGNNNNNNNDGGSYGNRNTNGGGNAYGNAYNNGSSMMDGSSGQGYTDNRNGDGSFGQKNRSGSNVNAPSSPVDTFPTQAGPFKDPTSPVKIPDNWGGVPPPTFSPGPRSTVSHRSNRDPTHSSNNIHGGAPSNFNGGKAPNQNGQTYSNNGAPSNNGTPSNDAASQWKPSAPSFVPRAQAGQPIAHPDEPKMSLKTFMQGSAGSKWAAENLPSSSSTSPQQATSSQQGPQANLTTVHPPKAGSATQISSATAGWNVTKPAGSVLPVSASDADMPFVPVQPTFNGPSNPPYQSSNMAPSTANAVGWGETATANASPQATAGMNRMAGTDATSAHAPQSSIDAGMRTSNTATSFLQGANLPPPPAREMTPRPSAQQQQQQGGWFNAPSQATSQNNGFTNAQQGHSASSMSPHERNNTHDSGFGQNRPASGSQAGFNANGWTTKTSPSNHPIAQVDAVAPLSSSMSIMQVNGNSNSWTQPNNTQNNINGNASMNVHPSRQSPAVPSHTASASGGWQNTKPAPPPTTASTSNAGWTPRAFNGVPDDVPQAQPAPISQQVLQNVIPSTGGLGWGDASNTAAPPPPVAALQPPAVSNGGGGIGWGDEPSSTAQPSKVQTGNWELAGSHQTNDNNGSQQQQNNNNGGHLSSRSSHFEDAAETVRPSDSISNVNASSSSAVNGHSNGYGNQNQSNGHSNGQSNGFSNGQSNGYSNGQNGYSSGNTNGFNSNSYGNGNVNNSYGNGGGFSDNNGGSNSNKYSSGGNNAGYGSGNANNYSSGGNGGGYGSGGGGGGYSNSGGFGNGGGYGGGGGGAPSQDRRFPGAGGSWASGTNEIPLLRNKWNGPVNRVPGDNVIRPVVPQATPGSGW